MKITIDDEITKKIIEQFNEGRRESNFKEIEPKSLCGFGVLGIMTLEDVVGMFVRFTLEEIKKRDSKQRDDLLCQDGKKDE